jgi:cold shock CspA family protein
VLFVTRKQNDFVPVAKLAGGSRTGSSQERDEGDKVTYDVVANRGKESAENLQVK